MMDCDAVAHDDGTASNARRRRPPAVVTPLSPRSAAKRRKITERTKFGILQALVDEACERHHVDFVSTTQPSSSGPFSSRASSSNGDGDGSEGMI